LRQAGVSRTERDAFLQEATAGDYDALLQVVMQWSRSGKEVWDERTDRAGWYPGRVR